ncbi:MAG: histidine kinase [Bacteroidetes bacterium HGW-Bacteroidetes-22]|nr:MAG: histidine kinase [Bacteroidetes bacterium HGW-Bacteroidetes-22]
MNDLDIKELRILLAEDNLINQKVASISLKKLGCKYDIAIDGIQAVAMYKKNDYDAILMDIQMPEMDGIEATKVIRQLETAHNELHPITIIAMTANAMIEDQDRYRRAGMDGFIPKPFKPDKLAEVLSNVKKR